uniref:Uncharacterized protein n=1 Tax=Arundo donax TaxID=35708 RepID=A0A0A8Z1F3_ARUDO
MASSVARRGRARVEGSGVHGRLGRGAWAGARVRRVRARSCPRRPTTQVLHPRWWPRSLRFPTTPTIPLSPLPTADAIVTRHHAPVLRGPGSVNSRAAWFRGESSFFTVRAAATGGDEHNLDLSLGSSAGSKRGRLDGGGSDDESSDQRVPIAFDLDWQTAAARSTKAKVAGYPRQFGPARAFCI